jgi:ring-1,2-phenylacetyl-CoA epoxidase subunit PaaE
MRTTIGGEEVRRTYSICSSPLDNEWRVAIKKAEGGLFSGFANELLQKGDILDVMPPVGSFYTELHPSHTKNYVAFAAGSGITPVLSLIKTTLATEPNSSFTLIYGNRSRSSIIFFEELEGLKNKFMSRFNLVHVLSRERTEAPLNSGKLDKDKLTALSKLVNYPSYDEFFICGPEIMIFCIKDFLEQQGINKKKIHFELFTTVSSSAINSQQSAINSRQSAIGNRQSAVTDGPMSKVTIKLDGRFFDFDLPLTSDTSILDAALKQGVDLPFACKGGVCCTCKARLLEGKVDMDVHWGLEDDEVEQGYILTCQSHPRTERVVVDFDVK